MVSFSQDFCDFSLHDFRSTKSETSLPHDENPMTVPLKSQFCHSSFSSDNVANDFERLNFEGIGPEGNFGSMGVLSVGQGSEEVGRGVKALDFPLNFADFTTNAKTSIEAGLPTTQTATTTTTNNDDKTKTDDGDGDNDDEQNTSTVQDLTVQTPTTTVLCDQDLATTVLCDQDLDDERRRRSTRRRRDVDDDDNEGSRSRAGRPNVPVGGMGNDDGDGDDGTVTITTATRTNNDDDDDVDNDDDDDRRTNNAQAGQAPPRVRGKSSLWPVTAEPPQTANPPEHSSGGAPTSQGGVSPIPRRGGPGAGQCPASELEIESRVAPIARREFGGATGVKPRPVPVVRGPKAFSNTPVGDGEAGSTLPVFNFEDLSICGEPAEVRRKEGEPAEKRKEIGVQTDISLPNRVTALWQCHCPDADTVVDSAGGIDEDHGHQEGSDIGAEEESSSISEGSSNEALRAVKSAQGEEKSAKKQDPRPRELATARADGVRNNNDGPTIADLDSLENSNPMSASREAASHPAEEGRQAETRTAELNSHHRRYHEHRRRINDDKRRACRKVDVHRRVVRIESAQETTRIGEPASSLTTPVAMPEVENRTVFVPLESDMSSVHTPVVCDAHAGMWSSWRELMTDGMLVYWTRAMGRQGESISDVLARERQMKCADDDIIED